MPIAAGTAAHAGYDLVVVTDCLPGAGNSAAEVSAPRRAAAEVPAPRRATAGPTAPAGPTADRTVVGAAEAGAAEGLSAGPLDDAVRAGLEPVLASLRGAWVGRPGSDGAPVVAADAIARVPVPVGGADADGHRRGHSDSTLWPLYHGAYDRPVFHRAWRQAYHRVNRRFAMAAAAAAGTAATVLVHGHRLQLVPGFLRKLRPDLRIGFFLPTPFPPPELFARLPTRSEILTGLLGADLVGFSGPQAAHNMLRLCRDVLGLGHEGGVVRVGDRPVTVGSFSVGVDAAEVTRLAGLPSVRARARQLRRQLGDPQTVLLGIDQLDASQGIEQRLSAYEELLRAGDLDAERTAIVQVVLPDPAPTSPRQALRGRIEHHVGRINGDHSRMGGAVVHYLHQRHGLAERVALYLAADLLTVTGLCEDACLVGKEYAAARTGDHGAVVLSSLTGGEADLPGAYLVNPHDGEALRETLLAALRADPADRAARLRAARAAARQRDAERWASRLLTQLSAPAEPLLGAAT